MVMLRSLQLLLVKKKKIYIYIEPDQTYFMPNITFAENNVDLIYQSIKKALVDTRKSNGTLANTIFLKSMKLARQ